MLSVLLTILSNPLFAEEHKPKWIGVDEAIVEKYASEYGRNARKSFIDTDRGDLLLFLFTISGLAGGFFLGYKWKELFSETKDRK